MVSYFCGMAKHTDDSIYTCRRFVRGSGERIFSGAQVASLCVSLPADIQAMRRSGSLGPAYSDKCEMLLDMTMGIWWVVDPRLDWEAFDVAREDFVQSAMVAMLKFVDRFDPLLSSWRTQGRWLRKEVRRDMERAKRKADPGQDALQDILRDNWQGVYDSASATEDKPRARIVARRVNGYVMDRARIERELDAILAPAIVEANTQLDLFALA